MQSWKSDGPHETLSDLVNHNAQVPTRVAAEKTEARFAVNWLHAKTVWNTDKRGNKSGFYLRLSVLLELRQNAIQSV